MRIQKSNICALHGVAVTLALALAGCFDTTVAPGSFSCSTDDKRCPEGLVCGANNTCVKSGADASTDGSMDAPGPDMKPDSGPDRAASEAPLPDAVVPDGPLPDAVVPDGPLPDAVVPDAPLPDVALDAAVPDAPVPDASLADAPKPDLPPPPDASYPDACSPDGKTPDWGGTTTCKHPPVTKKCTEDTLGNTWCQIPAGCFKMGSPKTETCREQPSYMGKESRHEVTLSRGFQIAATETTQQQFQSLMGDNPAKFNTCGSNCPVDEVNWHEAAAHCTALSRMKGLPDCYTCTWSGTSVNCVPRTLYSGTQIYGCPGFRLPSEAEWEYATRAGTETALYSGKSVTGSCFSCGTTDPAVDALAWYCPNSPKVTHPVALKTPNKWGLHDVIGNVWEWNHDKYQADLGTTAIKDPVTSSTQSIGVVRGGCFNTYASAARSAARFSAPMTGRAGLGFRCARTRDPDLVAHWKLDGCGNMVRDSKGSNHGSLKGPARVAGLLGKALLFDGKSAYVETPFVPAWQSGDSFSVVAWVKYTASGQDMTVFGFEATQKGSVWLHHWKAGQLGFRVQDDGFKFDSAKSSSSFNDGKWHLLVGVRDGLAKELLFYVDGVLEKGITDPTTTVINASQKLWAAIGSSNHNGKVDNFFNGAIDDVRVYDRALSPGEALELYKQKPCDWTPVRLKDLPAARRGVGVTRAHDGKIYLLGGQESQTGKYLRKVYMYDMWTNAYTDLGDILPCATYLRPYSIARGDDGKYYFSPPENSATGCTGRNVMVFDPSVPKVTEATATFGTSTHWSQSAVNGGNGKIYFLGGWSAGSAQTKVWEYDPVADTLTVVSTAYPKASGGSSSEGAVLGSDGMIYVFNNVYMKKLAIFDPVTKTVTVKDYSTLCSKQTALAWEYPRGTVNALCDFDKILSYDLTSKTVTAKPMSPIFGKNNPNGVTLDIATGSILTFGGDFNSVLGTKYAHRLDCMKN